MNTPNWNEVNIPSGTSWERTGRVIIENPYGGVPSLMTVEEYTEPTRDGGTKCTPFGNLSLTFDLNNPKHVLLYNTMNEIICELREARDTPVAPVIEEPIVTPDPIVETPVEP